MNEYIELIDEIPGIGRRSAERIIAETGIEMKQFRNADHFASWAGLVPGCNESAGKKMSSRIRKGNLYLKSTLVECAHSAIRHKDSFLCQILQNLRSPRRQTCSCCHCSQYGTCCLSYSFG